MAWYFTTHALKQMSKRGIKKDWVTYVIANHDADVPCKDREHMRRYFATLQDGRRLQVWVDERRGNVVTTAWGDSQE